MAVHDLERERVERLARELAPTLRDRGSIVVAAGDVDDLDRWRRAARRAARLIGWQIRTGVTPDGAHAWAASPDYEVTDAEKRETLDRLSRYLRPRGR